MEKKLRLITIFFIIFFYFLSTASSKPNEIVEPSRGDSAQNPPAQNPPAQNPPAQNPPAQNPPAQNPPAQNPPAQNPPAQNPPAQNPPAQNKNTPKILVNNVYRLGISADGDSIKRNSAGIGDIIIIEVANLKRLLDSAKTANKEIALFLDGREIMNLKPESGAPVLNKENKINGNMRYHLQREQKNDEAWADIFGKPGLGNEFFYRPTEISVGFVDGIPVPTDEKEFNLVRIDIWWFISCLIVFFVMLIILIFKAPTSGIIRDRVVDKAMLLKLGEESGDEDTPYSLGRFQMAFWFCLVLGAYFFIWLITGAYDIITPQILILLGLGAGTAISAAVIDNSKEQEIFNKTIILKDEKTTLEKEVAVLETNIAANPPLPNKNELEVAKAAKVTRMANIDKEVGFNIKALKPKTTGKFLDDILKDANGISFHRFQMFVWTFALGLLFLYAVWSRLSMPDFSATLLALQGLTATTYLGFKIPEKKPNS